MAEEFQDYPPPNYRESRPSPIRRDPDNFGDGPPRRRISGFYTPSPDECTSAMLCHLLAIFSGFIGPLIMWLVKKDESRFCDYHGRESLNFSINIFIFNLIAAAILTVITLVTCGFGAFLFPLLFCVYIYALVMHIIAVTATNRGEWYRYPMTIRIIGAPGGLESAPPKAGAYANAGGTREYEAASPNGEQRKGSLLWLWIVGGVFSFLLLTVPCLGGLAYFVLSPRRTSTINAPVSSANPAPVWPKQDQSPDGQAKGGPGKDSAKRQGNGQNPPGADIPDVAADPVGAALKDLQSDDRVKRTRAADSLSRQALDPARHDEVLAALQKLLHDDDQRCQAAASRALAIWATGNGDIPVLLDAWKVANFVDKKRIIDTFAKLKDSNTTKTLVEAVKDLSLRRDAEKALKGFGSEAEDDVATLLADGNFTIRQSACHIMKEIGTKKSLPALEAAAKDKVGSVAKAAQDAIAAIKARNP